MLGLVMVSRPIWFPNQWFLRWLLQMRLVPMWTIPYLSRRRPSHQCVQGGLGVCQLEFSVSVGWLDSPRVHVGGCRCFRIHAVGGSSVCLAGCFQPRTSVVDTRHRREDKSEKLQRQILESNDCPKLNMLPLKHKLIGTCHFRKFYVLSCHGKDILCVQYKMNYTTYENRSDAHPPSRCLRDSRPSANSRVLGCTWNDDFGLTTTRSQYHQSLFLLFLRNSNSNPCESKRSFQ